MGPVYSSVKKGDMGLVCPRVKKKTETSLFCTRVKKADIGLVCIGVKKFKKIN